MGQPVIRATETDGNHRPVQGHINDASTLMSLSVRDDTSIDAMTNARTAIEYEHHEIHGGSHFFICGFETLASGVSTDFAVVCPAGDKQLHMTFDVTGTSRTEMYIYEDSSVTTGTITAANNNDRNSTTSSIATIRKDPAVGTLGTLIYSTSSGLNASTPARASSPGLHDRNREIILKAGATTIFRITSRDDDNIVSYCGDWYEHTDRS